MWQIRTITLYELAMKIGPFCGRESEGSARKKSEGRIFKKEVLDYFFIPLLTLQNIFIVYILLFYVNHYHYA